MLNGQDQGPQLRPQMNLGPFSSEFDQANDAFVVVDLPLDVRGFQNNMAEASYG